MSTWIFLLLLLAATLFAVAAPLWSRRADRSLGRGIETDEIADRWSDEKDRLVAEQRALDLALANEEISEETHRQEREILQLEANRTLERLQTARSSGNQYSARRRASRHRVSGGILVAAVVLLTFGSAQHLTQQDLRRNVSPHADGRIPVRTANADVQKPSGSAGEADAPDIGAMVERLEARVQSQGKEATPDDLMMLGRSYRVMGRNEEAVEIYKRVLVSAPENFTAIMAVGSLLLNSAKKSEQAEADEHIERALRIKPDFPEALWLKSLSLVRDHKIEKAKKILNRLTPMVRENPPARAAVESLLSRLDQPTPTDIRPN